MRARGGTPSLVVALMAALLVVGSGMAWAANVIECWSLPCYGTEGDDDIRGSENDDLIYARSGNDVVRGLGDGDRHLLGGSGDDRLVGGEGDDGLTGAWVET